MNNLKEELEQIIKLDGCCGGDLCNGSKSHNDSLVDQILEIHQIHTDLLHQLPAHEELAKLILEVNKIQHGNI